MKKNNKNNRTFDSIKQAAGVLGVGVETIQAAKNSGECSEAFRGSRVIERPLVEWFSKNSDKIKDQAISLKDKKIAEEIRKLKIKNDKDESKLVAKVKVLEVWFKMAGRIRFLLDSKLENEYPAAVAGLDVPQARVYGKRLNDSICEGIQSVGEELEALS